MEQKLIDAIKNKFIEDKIKDNSYKMIYAIEIKKLALEFDQDESDIALFVFGKKNYKIGKDIKMNKELYNLKDARLIELKGSILPMIVRDKIKRNSSLKFSLDEIQVYSKEHEINLVDMMEKVLGIKDAGRTVLNRLVNGKVKACKSIYYEEEKERYFVENEEAILNEVISYKISKGDICITRKEANKISQRLEINHKDLFVRVLGDSESNFNRFMRMPNSPNTPLKYRDRRTQKVEEFKEDIIFKFVEYKMKKIEGGYIGIDKLKNFCKRNNLSLYTLIVEIFEKSPTTYYELKNKKCKNMQNDALIEMYENYYDMEIIEQIYFSENSLLTNYLTVDELVKIAKKSKTSENYIYKKIIRSHSENKPNINLDRLRAINLYYNRFGFLENTKIVETIKNEIGSIPYRHVKNKAIEINKIKEIILENKVDARTIMVGILGISESTFSNFRNGENEYIRIMGKYAEFRKEYYKKLATENVTTFDRVVAILENEGVRGSKGVKEYVQVRFSKDYLNDEDIKYFETEFNIKEAYVKCVSDDIEEELEREEMVERIDKKFLFLGSKLRETRRVLGLSREEVGKELKMEEPEKSIRNLEDQFSRATNKDVVKLMERYGIENQEEYYIDYGI
ncbi:MAG: hypothetical protein N4A47_04025 [Clostridia bacterium]|jgi:hypothetical protein|nr:hypothetical protein [Clostridia bacterium]